MKVIKNNAISPNISINIPISAGNTIKPIPPDITTKVF